MILLYCRPRRGDVILARVRERTNREETMAGHAVDEDRCGTVEVNRGLAVNGPGPRSWEISLEHTMLLLSSLCLRDEG